MFIGGSITNSFKQGYIPNLKGSFWKQSTGARGENSADGVFRWSNHGVQVKGSGYEYTGGPISFNARNVSTVFSDTEDRNKFYPNYYGVDWFIKFK